MLATGGGIVTATDTYELLRRRSITVWLKATPRDHWNRVTAQGDQRPLNRPDAVADMHRLWAERSPLYAEAALVVETSGKTIEEVVDAILAALPQVEPADIANNPNTAQHQPQEK